MKKLATFFVCLLLFGGLMYGGGKKEGKDPSESQESADTKVEETMTVTDITGRTVTVPKTIDRIATPNVDAYRILVQLGAQEKLVGIPSKMYGSQFSESDSIEIRVWPEAKKVTKVGGGPPNSEINLEAFLQVKPDIIIYWGRQGDKQAAERADELQSKINTPVLCLNMYTMGENLPAIEEAYMLMGKLVGKENRAEELINYFKTELESIASVTKSVPENKRPGVFMGGIRKISASSLYPPVAYLDLNAVVDKANYGKEIAKEQLMAWDPDVIFCHTPSQAYRPDLNVYLKDPVLQGVSAVKDKRVYHYKGYFMGWDIATGLVDTVYLAKLTYPELFADINMRQKANEILETFYRIPDLFDVLQAQSSLYAD